MSIVSVRAVAYLHSMSEKSRSFMIRAIWHKFPRWNTVVYYISTQTINVALQLMQGCAIINYASFPCHHQGIFMYGTTIRKGGKWDLPCSMKQIKQNGHFFCHTGYKISSDYGLSSLIKPYRWTSSMNSTIHLAIYKCKGIWYPDSRC